MGKQPKEKKKFKDTGFGKFLSKAGKLVPHIVEGAAKLATTGNPIQAISVVRDALEKKKNSDTRANELWMELDLKKLEYEKEMYRYEVEDRKSARDMYQSKSDIQDYLANRIINWNLVFIFAIAGVNIYFIKILDSTALAIVSNICGGLITALIQERNTVINFFFGSSKE